MKVSIGQLKKDGEAANQKHSEELEKRDQKFNKLREMSEKYMDEQKEEFNKFLQKMQADIDKKEKVQQQLDAKIDENTRLETEIQELKEQLQRQGWTTEISQAVGSGKHQSFILERMNKFDQDMLKHSKRNQKLVQENITLKNQVQKQDL